MENMKDLVCNNFNRLYEASEFKTYRSLALALKINENTIQRWVKKVSYPELPNIERLAEVFKVHPLEFYKSNEEISRSLPVSKTLQKMMAIPDEIYELAGQMGPNKEFWSEVGGAMRAQIGLNEKRAKKGLQNT
jgi:transcriptional regulator with XRE-family HTH domain